jgi:hypothetical protein
MSTAVTRTEELEYADIASHLISDEEIETRIARYEKAFGMSSEEFADKWQRGEMPDTSETNAWSILLDFR